MRTVYKYRMVEPDGHVYVVPLPEDAEILWAEKDWFWAEVHTEYPMQDRKFVVRGTGHPLNDNEYYLSTWFDGPFVWHLFEVFEFVKSG